MANHVIVTGNLGKDPLLKNLNDGKLVCSFSVAERLGKDKSQWHNIKCFGKTAEFAERYLKKGDKVLVEGRLMHRQWEDQDGRKKYGTEIVANHVEPFVWRQAEENNFDGL